MVEPVDRHKLRIRAMHEVNTRKILVDNSVNIPNGGLLAELQARMSRMYIAHILKHEY